MSDLTAKPRAVLDAAAQLFLAQGYGGVSMDAVAKRACVSKATLYAHFPGKEALFRSMIAEQCERMASEATAPAEPAEGIGMALQRLNLTLLRFLVAPSTLAMHRVVLAEAQRDPGLAEAFYAAGPARGRERIAAWIAEEQRRGRLRADADPNRAAADLSALLRGDLWLRAGLGLPPEPDEAALEAEAAAVAALFLRCYGSSASRCEAEAATRPQE